MLLKFSIPKAHLVRKCPCLSDNTYKLVQTLAPLISESPSVASMTTRVSHCTSD